MTFETIYAVCSDGKIKEAELSSDVIFFTKKVKISQPCASYSYDDYEIVDISGKKDSFNTRRFHVDRIWTSGFAENYCLNVKVVNEDGEEYIGKFYNDIRYNLPFELFIIQKREWDMENPFSVIVPFLSEIDKYGIDGYKEISRLRREQLDLNLKLKYADYKIERYKHTSFYTEELVLMEGMFAILDREFYNNECDFTNIKKIVLPSTIESIGDYAFARLESLETIVCKAKTPPQINLSFWDSGTKKVFVPSDSVEDYKVSWNSSFYQLEILPIE